MLSRPQLLVRKSWVGPWVGENVVLPCVAHGHPTPTVRYVVYNTTTIRLF